MSAKKVVDLTFCLWKETREWAQARAPEVREISLLQTCKSLLLCWFCFKNTKDSELVYSYHRLQQASRLRDWIPITISLHSASILFRGAVLPGIFRLTRVQTLVNLSGLMLLKKDATESLICSKFLWIISEPSVTSKILLSHQIWLNWIRLSLPFHWQHSYKMSPWKKSGGKR